MTVRPPHGLTLYLKNDCILESVKTYSNTNVEFILADVISCSKGHMQVVLIYKAPAVKLKISKVHLSQNLFPILIDVQTLSLWVTSILTCKKETKTF